MSSGFHATSRYIHFITSHLLALNFCADNKKQKSGDSAGLEGPRAKEARKERKVLEKKMALSRKRKLDSRHGIKISHIHIVAMKLNQIFCRVLYVKAFSPFRKEEDVLRRRKGDAGGEMFKKVVCGRNRFDHFEKVCHWIHEL